MTYQINKRRLIVRLILLALLVLLGFVLYYIGKEHEVLLDNKIVVINGNEYQDIAYLNLIVDGNEAKSIEFYGGDRDSVIMRGPKHRIKIEVLDEDTEEVLQVVERELNLGTISSLMISLPAVVAGADEILLPLPHLSQPAAPPDESAEESSATESDASADAALNVE